MRKIFALLLMTLICLPYNSYTCYAADMQGRALPDSAYTEDGKIKVTSSYSANETNPREFVYEAFVERFQYATPRQSFYGADGKKVEGIITYPNASDAKVGMFDLQWVFTPTESDKYEGKSGVIHYNLVEGEKPTVDEPTPPSLTATSVQLMTATAYDININDKPVGASYSWTSSDPTIVEVNSKNGKIKALKEGKSTITCDVAYEDGTTESLKSIINVGFDENAPVLTEDNLDLSIGDTYDINLENTVAKSKYRWVSSNKDIVKVNSLNGKVTALAIGKAYVTCTITTPTKQVIVLKCDISVTK